MTAPKNPAPLGLPLTVSTAEVVKNMGLNDKPDAPAPSGTAQRRGMVSTALLRPAEAAPFGRPPSPTDTASSTKAERQAAQRHASYMVGDTTPSKVDLSRKDIPGPMLLEVTQIDPYDGNPRQFENEATEDIRASLTAHGYTDAMVVTRRREGDRFMLAAGSNTTLKVLKQLWERTGDERYRYVNCIFQPFEGEARVLAQHLGENLNRGSMKFWEIAKGMTDLLAMIAKERGAALSVREQVAVLNERGLRAGPADVAYWTFATQRLVSLGPAIRLLTRIGVKAHLQPRLNALLRLASKYKIDEATYWEQIVAPRLAAQPGKVDVPGGEESLDAEALCRSIEAAFAEHVEESLTTVQRMLSLLKLSPELTLADLRLPMAAAAVSALAADSLPEPPEAAPAQAPLPLAPGLVRTTGAAQATAAPAAAPAARFETPNEARPQVLAPAAPAATAAASGLPAAQGALLEETADADPLGALMGAVRDLLTLAGLADTLRARNEMPLGFYLELPDPRLHARQQVRVGSPEHQARTSKTHVWWTLVLMTGQYREGSVPYMDRASGFYRFAASESDGPSPLEGTDIEETAPDIEDILMLRITGGAVRPVMRQLALVEDLAAQLFVAAPERWRRMLEVNRPRT